MKELKEVRYYNIHEMAFMLGISEKSVRNKMSRLKMKRYRTDGPEGIGLYTYKQLEDLRGDRRLVNLKRDFSYEQLLYERNNAPIVVTYYIYESKMNKI